MQSRKRRERVVDRKRVEPVAGFERCQVAERSERVEERGLHKRKVNCRGQCAMSVNDALASLLRIPQGRRYEREKGAEIAKRVRPADAAERSV